MKAIKLAMISAFFALSIFSCNQAANNTITVNNGSNTAKNISNVTNQTSTQTSTPTDELAIGKSVYTEKCVACHRDNGTGGKVTIENTTINADNFTTEKMKNMPDEKYIGYVENGVVDEGMPAFKGKLTDAQIKAVVKYIRTEFQSK